MVDINGAWKGVNRCLLKTGKKRFKSGTRGGLRTMADIDFLWTRAFPESCRFRGFEKNPNLSKSGLKHGINRGRYRRQKRLPLRKLGRSSAENYIDLAVRMESLGVETIVFTDIGRDGMLNGPNVEQLAALNSAVACNIVASGGITTVEDIKNLKKHNLYGAICGRSLYTGALDWREAVLAAGEGDA